MMPWTARWSSIILSDTEVAAGPAPGTRAPGAREARGTWLGCGGAREGGAAYADPGAAPAEALRKNVSHDCKQNKM